MADTDKGNYYFLYYDRMYDRRFFAQGDHYNTITEDHPMALHLTGEGKVKVIVYKISNGFIRVEGRQYENITHHPDICRATGRIRRGTDIPELSRVWRGNTLSRHPGLAAGDDTDGH